MEQQEKQLGEHSRDPSDISREILTDKRLEKAIMQYLMISLKPDKPHQHSFSKSLCIVVIALTIAVIIGTFIFIYMFNDITPLEYLIPSIFAEAAVVSGFYSYKAKAENKIKLSTRNYIINKMLDTEIEEDYDGSPVEEEDQGDEDVT